MQPSSTDWGPPPSSSIPTSYRTGSNTSHSRPRESSDYMANSKAGSSAVDMQAARNMDGSIRNEVLRDMADVKPVKRRRGSEGTSVDPDDDRERPLAITCAPCRMKKIKCDSKKPSCDNCGKNPTDCFYPVKQKPGLRAGTGGDVNKRLEQLEERVNAQENRLAEQERQLQQYQEAAWRSADPARTRDGGLNRSDHTLGTGGYPVEGNNGGPSISLDMMSEPLGGTSSFPMDTDRQGAGGISMDMLSQHDAIVGFSSTNMSGIDTGSGAAGGNGKLPMGSTDMFAFAGPSASPSGISMRSFSDPRVLPPDDIVRDLISLYFQHIHTWAPFLSPGDLPNSAPWDIVVHALVVVTLRFSTDVRIATNRDQYRMAAKTHVLAHAIESTSLSSVQALALLALDLIGSEQGPSSWGILALLTRSAVHLGLAREDDSAASNLAQTSGMGMGMGMGMGLGMGGRLGFAPSNPSLSRTSIIPPPANWHEDESRRRLFWLIFCLDRYACVSTGWDFALPDFEIKRRLPCADEIWSRQDWYYTPLFRPVLHRETVPDFTVLSPMASLVEALDLLGRAHTLQSQTIEPGDARAVETRKDATMTLSSATRRWFAERHWSFDGIGLTIQAIHHATLLKLNAYYAFPALSNGEPQEPFTSTCLASCRAVVQLTDSARALGWQHAASPLFVWGCWVAARVLFVHAFLGHQMGPDAEFDTVLRGLKEMANYWGLANQYVKLLERAKRKWLASTTAAASTGGSGPLSLSPGGAGLGSTSTNNPNALPDAIHVLLDLRRTAYSAVNTNVDETPQVSPPELQLGHLPAWAVQPLLGDLYSWIDLPAGLFQPDM